MARSRFAVVYGLQIFIPVLYYNANAMLFSPPWILVIIIVIYHYFYYYISCYLYSLCLIIY